jgi:uncharacterized membrane protein YjjB (DUF3815 family)
VGLSTILLSTILLNSVWAGVSAAGSGILLTAPSRNMFTTFLCGLTGRFVRDALMVWGVSQTWSTGVAAAVLVVVASAMVRRHKVSPVVLICGVLPLGAATAMFNVILELIRVSSLTGEALSAASVALIANTGKVFAGTLSIALGLAAGLAILRLVKREEEEGV